MRSLVLALSVALVVAWTPIALAKSVVVAGFVTLPADGATEWIGAGVGEELSDRLAMDSARVQTADRLEVNNLLSAAKVAPTMLSGVEGGPERYGPWAEVLRRATKGERLFSADVLIVGSVHVWDTKLRGLTRLVDVGRGVMVGQQEAEIPRSGDRSADVQQLGIALTRKWCSAVGGLFGPEMERVSPERGDVYQAFCEARTLLYHSKYRDCLEKVRSAQEAMVGPEMLGRLLETRDQAYEMLVQEAEPGSDEQKRLKEEAIRASGCTYHAARLALAFCRYYEGRAEARAGQWERARSLFVECLKLRPSRLMWAVQELGPIDSPTVAGLYGCVRTADGRALVSFLQTGRIEATLPLEGRTVAVAGDTRCLYVATDTGKLHCFDPDGCYERSPWPLEGAYVALAGIGRQVLAVTPEGSLHCIDGKTARVGSLIPYAVRPETPVVYGTTAVARGADGALVVVDKAAGTSRAVQASDPQAPLLCVGEGFAVLGGQGLRTVDLATGAERWSLTTQTPAIAAVASGQIVFALTQSGHALRIGSTGARGWTAKVGGSDAGAPSGGGLVVHRGVAYVTAGRRLVALDAESGRELWSYRAGDVLGPPVIAGDHLVLGCRDGALRWFMPQYPRSQDLVETLSKYPPETDLVERATAELMECQLALGTAPEAVRWGTRLLLECPERSAAFTKAMAAALQAANVTEATTPGTCYRTIWGEPGRAVAMIAAGSPLPAVLEAGKWASPDALAAALNDLAGKPDWDGADAGAALGSDPKDLCPPSLVRSRDLLASGGVGAAQLYAAAARVSLDRQVALEYAQEALRLAPQWEEARKLVQRLDAPTKG